MKQLISSTLHWQIVTIVICFAWFSDLSASLRRSRLRDTFHLQFWHCLLRRCQTGNSIRWCGIDWKGNAVRCCSSPRYCKKDDSFTGVRSGTTVLYRQYGRERGRWFRARRPAGQRQAYSVLMNGTSVGGKRHGNVYFCMEIYFPTWIFIWFFSLCTA